MLPGPVHPTRPEINGFCFDETNGLDLAGVNGMAATGHVFLTQFRAIDHDGRPGTFGGALIAKDIDDARQEAERRGLGETVTGTLDSVIEA